MENKAHALAAGAFVVLLSALLISMALWLTRDSGEQLLIDISTPEVVSGLQPQASVRFKGINVGKVSSIGFDPKKTGNVLIRLAVRQDTPLTQNTFASLGFQGVTGIAFVQLDALQGDSPPLPNDGEIPRIPLRAGLVSQMTDQGTRLLAQIEETSSRLNQLLAVENQKSLMDSIQAAGQTAQQLTPVLKAAGSTLESVTQASSRMADAAQAVTNNVNQTANEFSQLTRRIQQPDGLLDQVARSAESLSVSSKALQTETLPRLNQTLDEASRTSRTVGRTASSVSENPQALIFGNRTQPGPGEPGFTAQGGRP